MLRELAHAAVWVAQLEAAVDALEDLVSDLDPPAEADTDAPSGKRAVDDAGEPLRVALAVVTAAYEEADAALEGRLAAWLAQDPEHWPIFRLALLESWRDEGDDLHRPVPGWVRVLTTNAALAHFQQDPYGRRRALDLD